IRRIDGSQYLQPVTYKLDCGQRLTGADDLRMQLQGPTSVINGETVLNTGIDGFGIRIQNATNDSLITVGSSAWLP
ncbi:Yfc fimbriae subunit YfcR, partial [Escherichia coli]